MTTTHPGFPITTDAPDSAMVAAMGVLAPTVIRSRKGELDDSPASRLLASLERHIASEARSITQCRRLAQKSPDQVVAFLMKLMVADEERHHRLLRRLAARLRDSLQWTHTPGAFPTEPAPSGAVSQQMIDVTRQRLREERETIRHFRRIARENKHLYYGLFELLLQVMILDSQKHERVLAFILQRSEKGTAP